MATFLVLPPRELLEHEAAAFVARVLPGVIPPADLLTAITDRLAGRNTFVVHREDLADATDVAGGLRDGFGAEPGDRVLEIGSPRALATAGVREWVVGGNVSATVRIG